MVEQERETGPRPTQPLNALNTLRDALAARRRARTGTGMQAAPCPLRSVRSRFSSLKRLCLEPMNSTLHIAN